uniref:Calcineurin-like phosphoesterase domain-containing protein n=2 Tax=Amorphochlora amoebiformis TaxID=1561963 RepID=A0A7S0D258_9EUKA|mmetsp:Transcript_16592/g.26291  ORF Transcript_16592/g.26291 Transcript_16592/m.26291 type:complete len:456 (+) Transcript_16592:250-1617(+)
MGSHHKAREEIKQLLKTEAFGTPPSSKSHLVSLGDLGAYGSAGTTQSFELAREYLDGFGIGYNLVTGNHDLEGMDEFKTDRENFKVFKEIFEVEGENGQFSTQIAPNVLLVGLSTERFRDNKWSSHEVYISGKQLDWFQDVLNRHPSEDGWNIIVFSHAPPMGSGLRVLNSVHVRNTCAWLNHAQIPSSRRAFHRLARQHGGVVAWFSGHFHLSHDYDDSISMQRGLHPGSTTAFVQVGVIGDKSTRDGRRQSRVLSCDSDMLRIFTLNHHHQTESERRKPRLDLEIPLSMAKRARLAAMGSLPSPLPVPETERISEEDNVWFWAKTPQQDDGCYLPEAVGGSMVDQGVEGAICWWHMANGAVLGVHDGLLVEYDSETHAPVGLLVDKEDMIGRHVHIDPDGETVRLIPLNTEGPEESIELRPEKDGSYFQQFQENKWKRHLKKKAQIAPQEVSS